MQGLRGLTEGSPWALVGSIFFLVRIFFFFDIGGGAAQGLAAGLSDDFEELEKVITFGLGQRGEDFRLQIDGDLAGLHIDALARRGDADAVGAAVGFVRLALDDFRFLHAAKQAGDGIGIAGHHRAQLALGGPFGVALGEPAEDGELIGGDAQVMNAAAKGLVEAVPGEPKQRGQAAATGGVERVLIVGRLCIFCMAGG